MVTKGMVTKDVALCLRTGTSAQFYIGRAFLDGISVTQNRKIGEAWWLRAANDGKGERQASTPHI